MRFGIIEPMFTDKGNDFLMGAFYSIILWVRSVADRMDEFMNLVFSAKSCSYLGEELL